MLSNACQYAIRAILYLSQKSKEERKIGVREIGEALEIPKPYLAQLLRNLAASDILTSTKGPGGGYFLTKSNRDKTLWDIVVCIDGSSKFDSCFLGLERCDDVNPCPVHYAVAPFKETILKDFKLKSIARITREMERNGTIISLKGLI